MGRCGRKTRRRGGRYGSLKREGENAFLTPTTRGATAPIGENRSRCRIDIHRRTAVPKSAPCEPLSGSPPECAKKRVSKTPAAEQVDGRPRDAAVSPRRGS